MNTVATAVPDVIPLPAALAAVWGAFLFEGLLTSDRDPLYNQQVLESWGQGCIELVIETTACLTELWQQVAITWNNNDADFPGVFEYEVVSRLGEYLGRHLLTHDGYLPSREHIHEVMHQLIQDFLAPDA
jgi:hypothetical protein